MIQANEVRIGNWFSYNGTDEEMQIDTTDFQYVINGHITDIEPIPLTEEWLIKLGFKQWVEFGHKTGTFDLMPLCGVSYDIVTKKVMILEKGNPNSHWIERKIEYVHELQNLYFALTGEELTITH